MTNQDFFFFFPHRYGNIEDLVIDVTVATAGGLVEGGKGGRVRVSQGIELKDLVLGSEGTMGIVTSAVIRVRSLPQVVEYDSAVFRCWEEGVGFMREVAKDDLAGGALASVRLVDNTQLRMGGVLKEGAGGGLQGVWEQVKKMMVGWKLKGGRLEEVVGVSMVFEGKEEEVKAKKKIIMRVVEGRGGVMTGADRGKAGYELTYSIAYIRDFAMTYSILGESLETFVNWSRYACINIWLAKGGTACVGQVLEPVVKFIYIYIYMYHLTKSFAENRTLFFLSKTWRRRAKERSPYSRLSSKQDYSVSPFIK